MAEPSADRLHVYASTIWEASRADEGTISATGAQHVARAVIALSDAELDSPHAQAAIAAAALRDAAAEMRARFLSGELLGGQADEWLMDRADLIEASCPD